MVVVQSNWWSGLSVGDMFWGSHSELVGVLHEEKRKLEGVEP